MKISILLFTCLLAVASASFPSYGLYNGGLNGRLYGNIYVYGGFPYAGVGYRLGYGVGPHAYNGLGYRFDGLNYGRRYALSPYRYGGYRFGHGLGHGYKGYRSGLGYSGLGGSYSPLRRYYGRKAAY